MSNWFELGAELEAFGRIPKQLTREEAVAYAVEQRRVVQRCRDLIRELARAQGDATTADLLAIWHDKALTATDLAEYRGTRMALAERALRSFLKARPKMTEDQRAAVEAWAEVSKDKIKEAS